MNKRDALVVLLSILLLNSCNSNQNQQQEAERKAAEIIEFVSFPNETETALPYLFSDKETTVLSWVKILNDSTSQLNYSYLTDDKWEEPRKIITGRNWFINWADFPSIAVNNGNLLTHFLKKSSPQTFSYDIKLNLLPKGT